MTTTLSNFGGDITKGYALGEIDSRLPYITDIVPAKNTEAFIAGQVVIYDAANNYYELSTSGGDIITNVVVTLEAKAETVTRVNALICGLVCIETASVLVECDYCKLAATGKVTKFVVGTDDLNIQAPIIFKKQANKISEGLGKAVTNATTSAPGKYILAWINSPLGRGINAAAA